MKNNIPQIAPTSFFAKLPNHIQRRSHTHTPNSTICVSLHVYLTISFIWTGFTIIWRNEKIHVFRPDVECTNGVIHVLDLPFLQEGDVIIAASSSGLLFSLSSYCFMLIAMNWLLRLL